MDMMMVDATDVPGVALGDRVTLLGRDGGQEISVDDVAAWAGTVNYEILCGISKRVPRIYSGGAPGESGGKSGGKSGGTSGGASAAAP
jgi:alanine racemase